MIFGLYYDRMEYAYYKKCSQPYDDSFYIHAYITPINQSGKDSRILLIFAIQFCYMRFILVAALFLRSSKPLYDWLMNHPKLGPYIKNFMVHKSIPLKVKIISVSMVWITLLYCAVFVADHWAFRLFFVLLAAGITAHILSYNTL